MKVLDLFSGIGGFSLGLESTGHFRTVAFCEIDCFDLCEILRLKLTGYADTLNLHIMNDGSGNFMGCICG